MRSDLIFGAAHHISNRYLLVRALAKAARALHKPGTRVQDTMNDVLVRFSHGDSIQSHDAVPGIAAAASRGKRVHAAKPGSLKRANVATIRDARQPVPEPMEAQETRKSA